MSGAQEWQAWIGRAGELIPGPYPVSAAAIGYLAEALEDERLARHVASARPVVAPRSFVNIATRVPNWRPASAQGPNTFLQAMLVPLPATSAVNMSVDQRYFHPLQEGDRLSSRSTIRSIEPKTTRLGEGFVVVEEIEHRNGELLMASTLNTLLRFSPRPKSDSTAAAPAPARAEAPAASAASKPASELPPVRMPITMTLLAKGAAAVRDFSPLHHDVAQARAVGHPTAFLSYSFQVALITSAIGRWFDGDAALQRLKLEMKRSIYLGRTVSCTAMALPAAAGDEPGTRTYAISLSTEDGLCSSGVAVLGAEGRRS